MLLVYTPADFPYTADLFSSSSSRNYAPAPSLQAAHIVVRADGNEIVIEPRTPALRKCQDETRFLLTDLAQLPAVLDGVAHFSFFLDSTNDAVPLRNCVTLQMHRLLVGGEWRDRGPDRSVGRDGDMVEDGAVVFAAEEGASYGFTIRNAGPEDLFAFLFYFDPETYTIQLWYKPPFAHGVPPLPAGETLEIGMGINGGFRFGLEPHQSSSSGYIKLFVANEYFDLEWIERKTSPFEPIEPAELADLDSVRGDSAKKLKGELGHVPKWDALTVMLTMTAE